MSTTASSQPDEHEFFATCPYGFEGLLAGELKRLRVRRVRPLQGGVAFFGSKCDGYRVCLWSRVASRVLRVVKRVSAQDAQDLYQQVQTIAWERFIAPSASIALFARGRNDQLRNTQFVALKAKDAICDYLRARRHQRPDVKPDRPDVAVVVSLHGTKATISLDYAGESLHRRGYRADQEQVEAPLKEALAAGMLLWGGWVGAAGVRGMDSGSVTKRDSAVTGTPAAASAADTPRGATLVDPTCGSGTLVLEAAMMAADRAPGLTRDYWGFAGHADFDEAAFSVLLDEADARFAAGLERLHAQSATAPHFVGADSDPRAIQIAQASAKRLGLDQVVRFVVADCARLPKTLAACRVDLGRGGLIVSNPPYGVRLLSSGLHNFYQHFSQGLRTLTDAWKLVVITPDASFDTRIGYDANQTLSTYNGAIEVTLRSYRLGTSFVRTLPLVTLSGTECSVATVSDHPDQFAARLRKMYKLRAKWARKQGIYAYRIYDADLPDYAVSVDVFIEHRTGNVYVLVCEYQAPKEIDRQKAKRRFMDACRIAQALCEVPDKRLFTRVRRQEKGGGQYASHRPVLSVGKQASGSAVGGKSASASIGVRVASAAQDNSAMPVTPTESTAILVEEAGHLFEVNLANRLDTGLFLDHRITRQMVGNLAEHKRFLNLFAYTGTASVYAAAGGAVSTITVDMNNTYLAWAKRNMTRAGFTSAAHQFVRADVLQWVEEEGKRRPHQYDLVFLDPPTFSNSKAMGQTTWDIQRDHAVLLAKIKLLLAPGATVVFSGNLRSFKLDEDVVRDLGFGVENVTAQTIPEDFGRNPRIHFCYVLALQD